MQAYSRKLISFSLFWKNIVVAADWTSIIKSVQLSKNKVFTEMNDLS